ncbi:MAG TPA: putative glycoside hydrolase [Gemmatimonadaceae bacterium]|nr:putative glycoside hydrolase [Gemmatimonadaceae bacterium]
MHRFLFLFAAITACTAAAEHAADKQAPSAAGVSGASGAVASDSAKVARPDTSEQPTVVRALYVNRWASQSKRRMAKLIAAADSTEINGLVIDMKDEFGLNYKSANPTYEKNAGTAARIRDVRALLDTLKAHKIFAIARIVVFKDSVTADRHPEWTIRRTDGSVWRDKKGLAWVNPYHKELWDYNIGVAEELVKLGFGEIQFDYIRFPEPYASLPKQVFAGSDNVSKPEALAEFLKQAKTRINKLGVRSTADVFGLVTTVGGALEVGQEWEKISPNVDVVLPMVYPSHYPHGSFGIPVPNADPYKVILTAITRARERDTQLGIKEPEHVRPWLQAFTLGKPEYGATQLSAEKKAVYESGYDGWVMWNPGSIYDVYTPALEKTLESRKKP